MKYKVGDKVAVVTEATIEYEKYSPIFYPDPTGGRLENSWSYRVRLEGEGLCGWNEKEIIGLWEEYEDKTLSELVHKEKDEYELIEPQEPTECNHIWDNRPVLAFSKEKGEFINIKKCMKCGKWEEPTDNTKIEELNIKLFSKEHFVCSELERGIMDNLLDMQDKINEVIRKINKENNNE